MTASCHYPIKPSPESKARILKYLDMLWMQVGEQVAKLSGDQDIPSAFVLAYENGAQVMWLTINEETKPLIMAGIRENTVKVADDDRLVFGALCTPTYVTEVPGGSGVRREMISLHVETPISEWLRATGFVERHPNGTVALGKRDDQWLDEHVGMGVQGQMMGFFPNSQATRTRSLN